MYRLKTALLYIVILSSLFTNPLHISEHIENQKHYHSFSDYFKGRHNHQDEKSEGHKRETCQTCCILNSMDNDAITLIIHFPEVKSSYQLQHYNYFEISNISTNPRAPPIIL